MIQQILDKLENNPDVISVKKGDPFPHSHKGLTVYKISFTRLIGENIESDWITFEMVERTVDGETVLRYRKGIPDVLRDKPEPVVPRELFMDEKDVIDHLEAYGEVIKDSVRITRRQSYDAVTADLIEDGKIKEGVRFRVTGADIPTWEELGPYHGGNTLPLGFIVEHKKKYWKSNHPTNSWEPDKVGEDIWEEVPKSELVKFRPVA